MESPADTRGRMLFGWSVPIGNLACNGIVFEMRMKQGTFEIGDPVMESHILSYEQVGGNVDPSTSFRMRQYISGII